MGKTYIKEENGEKVLYEEGSLIDMKLGKLYENFDGSLETRNSENYHLEKESSLFGTPDYTIKSSKGNSGILKSENSFVHKGDRYEGELETSLDSGSSNYKSSGSGGSSGSGNGTGSLGCLGSLAIGVATVLGLAIFIEHGIKYATENGNGIKKERYIESTKKPDVIYLNDPKIHGNSEREKTQLQKEEDTQKRQSQLETSINKTQSYNLIKQTKQNLESRTSELRTNSQTAQQSRLYQPQTSSNIPPASRRRTYYESPQRLVQEEQPAQMQQVSRLSYLESKYDLSMAARLNSGKIWKGMNAEMVKDSWGAAEKINRVISRNIIKEEWIFKNTWLYFENNTLVEWGPTRK